MLICTFNRMIPLLLVSSLLMLSPSDTTANDAETLYKEGVRHFQSGEYTAAADAFRAAYKLRPSWRIFYNIGQSEAAAKRYDLALDAFEAYLAEGGDEIDVERKENVIAELDRFRKMVGSLEIVAQEGAVVYLDDIARGKAPLISKLAVTAGKAHTAYAVVDGIRTEVRTFKIRGEDSLTLRLGAEQAEASEPQPMSGTEEANETFYVQTAPATRPYEKRVSPLGLAGWITTGMGTGALIAGIATGVITMNLDDELTKSCSGGHCSPSESDKIDTMNHMRWATNILLVSGGTFVAAGITMIVVTMVKKKRRNWNKAAILPEISPAMLGLQIGGSF